MAVGFVVSYILFASMLSDQLLQLIEGLGSDNFVVSVFLKTLVVLHHYDTALVLWNFIYVLMLASSVYSGIKASKWELNGKSELSMINLVLLPGEKKILVFCEQAIWELRNGIIGFLPMAAALSYLAGNSLLHTLLTLAIMFLTYAIQSIAVSSIHNKLVRLREKSSYLFHIIIQSVLLRLALIAVLYVVGSAAGPWMNAFPLVSRHADLDQYLGWSEFGESMVVGYFEQIMNLLLLKVWPHSWLAAFSAKLEAFMLILIYLAVLVFIIKLGSRDAHPSGGAVRAPHRLEAFFQKLGRAAARKNQRNLMKTRISVFFRSRYVLFRFNHLSGSTFSGCKWASLQAFSVILIY
ncbi:hypothetical protein [Paenibacillus puerhi]|uniref:hypothetical protein n=1 Tax=Paenibacillus puerhi TaxID=2692622 RepID=UPI00135B0D9E|nr:hypothetical protein [Paenibacillus puerhi]